MNIQYYDICDIIRELDTIETDNYNKHMTINPNDEQRKRDHIIANATYCQILHAVYDKINEMTE